MMPGGMAAQAQQRVERPEQPVTESDRELIRQALGTLRYEPLAVVDRCPDGHPRVVLGFHGDGVSTTVYWLTCPYLLTVVSRLEAAGAIDRIEGELQADPQIAAAFARTQELYRRLLFDVFRKELPDVDPEPYIKRVRGVGGVADARFVKCLHAQVAFTLATGRGPAGAMALRELGYERGQDGVWLGPHD